MDVKISGKPKNITKKETRALLNWVARELCVDRYKTPIFIKLKFIKNLMKSRRYRGSAIWDDNNHRPREFTVEVDANLTKKLSTETILHEMVHVKQYAKGELKDLMRYFSLKRWGSRLVDESKIAYDRLPWEKEAYKLEEVLFQKWKEYKSKKRQ